MEEIAIQINGGIMINVNVSVKNVMYVKKIAFGTLLHVNCENRIVNNAIVINENSSQI